MRMHLVWRKRQSAIKWVGTVALNAVDFRFWFNFGWEPFSVYSGICTGQLIQHIGGGDAAAV